LIPGQAAEQSIKNSIHGVYLRKALLSTSLWKERSPHSHRYDKHVLLSQPPFLYPWLIIYSFAVGLDAAGKTTMLYKMKLGGAREKSFLLPFCVIFFPANTTFIHSILFYILSYVWNTLNMCLSIFRLWPLFAEIVTTIPTIGFNVETVEYRGIAFTVWDVGGRDGTRKLLHHYYPNTEGVILCVDTNDIERLPEAASELNKLLSEPMLASVPFLIFANKRDLKGACSMEYFKDHMGIHAIRNRRFRIQTLFLWRPYVYCCP
jgi:small GTP-binding protein